MCWYWVRWGNKRERIRMGKGWVKGKDVEKFADEEEEG